MAVTLNANTSTGFIATSDTSGVLQLQTGGTAAVTVDASQLVGIGTASPSRKLVVSNAGAAGFEFGAGVGAGSGNEVLNYNRSTSLYIPSFAYASTHTFYAGTAGGTRALDIDSSGNVGIGTSSPTVKLDVNGIVGGSGSGFNPGTTAWVSAAFKGTGSYGGGISFVDGSNGATIYAGGANLIFGNGATSGGTLERMRIDSSGNLLVGDTATIGSHKAFIKQAAANPCLALQVTGSDFQNMVTFYNSSGTIKGSISSPSGSAVAYNTSSDYRLKENIAPMAGALAKVQQLKPCTYTWKDSGQAWEGFIAHEVAEVIPNAVAGTKDAVDAEGNPQYQGIDTSFLVATLTAAIKEQQAIITSLTDRITALEGTTP